MHKMIYIINLRHSDQEATVHTAAKPDLQEIGLMR